ncbi:MAG: EAL domain-containing protein [Nitrosomonas sp.]|nr:EAL domain-containing protein [Nitrosomonas sp.]MDP1951882.1 EAL domain-containing protein [Nitrosomonas sp.]
MINTQTPLRNKLLILIVDDNEFIRELIKSYLAPEDFTFIEARNGEEAITEYLKNNPDVVLMDVVMPKMNGYQACKKLRELSGSYSLPIIMMTSLKDDKATSDAFDAQATDFISKPISRPLLIHRVSHALHIRDSELQLQAKKSQLAASQEVTGSGYFEYNPITEKVLCSDALYSLLGLEKKDQIISLAEFLLLTQTEDRETVKQAILKAAHEGVAYLLSHKMVGAEGLEYIVQHQTIISPIGKTDRYHLLGTILDITSTKNKDILIEEQQQFDTLTGLPNRQQLEDRLTLWLTQSDQREELFGMFFIGLDRFKNINSSFGHHAADNILKSVANRLRAHENEDLVAARFSGDEFVIIAKQLTSNIDVEAIAQRLKETFAEHFFVEIREVFITISIGIVTCPLIELDEKQVIQNAESAMFQAKRQGRNRHEYYRDEIGNQFNKRLHLETNLRKALDNGEFEVYYQPQVSVHNRRIIGMEALIRWNHPELGLVSPDDFIPIAEETGLIVPIGSWVMESAARQTVTWRDKGFGLLRIGINLSAKQFQGKDLAKEVADVISKTGIMPPSLDLELTESAVMNDIGRTIVILNQLKEMGTQTSMDDFGTGYSSLSYLQQMPLHTLKIDRAFIMNIQPDGSNGEIAKVIIALCHALGLNVVAEGVETEDHMKFLSKHECNEAQGYLFSRPLPAVEMEKLLYSMTTHVEENMTEDFLF